MKDATLLKNMTGDVIRSDIQEIVSASLAAAFAVFRRINDEETVPRLISGALNEFRRTNDKDLVALSDQITRIDKRLSKRLRRVELEQIETNRFLKAQYTDPVAHSKLS